MQLGKYGSIHTQIHRIRQLNEITRDKNVTKDIAHSHG